MNIDPLETLIQGHVRVSEWLHTMWNALGLLDGDGANDLQRLEEYFRIHVREHFEFEETAIFPVLLEVDTRPEVASLIAELRADHARILGACGRLLMDLAWCMTAEDSATHIRAVKGQARALIEDVLAHASHEDEALLPRIQQFKAVLSSRMKAARGESEI